MIDLGMSRKEYYEFLREVEDSMYNPNDFVCWRSEITEDEETGLKITPYQGRRNKSYSQPMIDYKTDQCVGDSCYRCKGTKYTRWDHTWDEVVSANWYPVFVPDPFGFSRDCKSARPVHYNRVFAARRPHP